MRTQPLLHLVFLLSIASLVTHHAMALVDGYRPIRNVHNPYVMGISKFAVAEHNKQSGQKLVFVRVVSGERHVAAGSIYKLLIEAKDAGTKKKYETVVYDKPRQRVRNCLPPSRPSIGRQTKGVLGYG